MRVPLLITMLGCAACSGGDGPTGSGSGSDTIVPDARDTSPIAMRNLTAIVNGANVRCATNESMVLVQCPELSFRFVLANGATRAIEQIDYLRLAFHDVELYNQVVGLCTVEPWTVKPGGESELINVHFSYTRMSQTDGQFKPRFYYPCGGAQTRAYAPGPYSIGDAMPSLPTAGLVTLKVQGILEDATPFVAESVTALNP